MLIILRRSSTSASGTRTPPWRPSSGLNIAIMTAKTVTITVVSDQDKQFGINMKLYIISITTVIMIMIMMIILMYDSDTWGDRYR